MFWSLFALFCAGLLLLKSAQGTRNTTTWDCDRPWPELELFLPVNLRHVEGRVKEWKEVFLRTYLLFWPLEVSKTKLLFLADEDQRTQPGLKDLEKTIADHGALSASARIAFNNAPRHIYGGKGHDLQQYIMFYADKFTSSEYVGFVDTDCFFLTYVDREDIFENGKPVVVARSGDLNKPYYGDGFWNPVTATTYDLLGILEPMRCMAYFPVVIKTEHLKKLREFLEKKYKKPFDHIFRDNIVRRGAYSQFNIFCAYLFHYFKEDYVWYVSDTNPEWDFSNPIYGQEGNRSIYTEKMRYPKPRIAMHARYHETQVLGEKNVANFNQMLQTGICFSPPFPKPKEYEACDFYRSKEDFHSVAFTEMHRFEYADFTKTVARDALAHAAYERYQRHGHCPHDYGGREDIAALMRAKRVGGNLQLHIRNEKASKPLTKRMLRG